MQRLRRWYAWFVRRAPRIRDLMYVGFSLLTIVLQATSNGRPGWAGSDWFVLGLGGIASLALWWRRRYPVVVTVIAVIAMGAAGIFMPVGLALLTLAIRRRDLVLAVLTVAAYVAYVIPTSNGGGSNLWAALFTGPFLIGTWVAIGAYIGARRDLMVSLRDRAERAEAEQELRADQARLGERARIAQEMHDVLAHKVSLIALHAGGLEVNPAVGPEKVERLGRPDPRDRAAGDGGPARSSRRTASRSQRGRRRPGPGTPSRRPGPLGRGVARGRRTGE